MTQRRLGREKGEIVTALSPAVSGSEVAISVATVNAATESGSREFCPCTV
jgi:hypothetical protein